jgi:hypothetical protein
VIQDDRRHDKRRWKNFERRSNAQPPCSARTGNRAGYDQQPQEVRDLSVLKRAIGSRFVWN